MKLKQSSGALLLINATARPVRPGRRRPPLGLALPREFSVLTTLLGHCLRNLKPVPPAAPRRPVKKGGKRHG